MCGIAGYKIDRKFDNSVLERMLDALYHRGPDSAGVYRFGSYNAGMRRLSINDLKTGDQPLFNQDKSVVLLYNGEIYNSPQLRRDLEYRGYNFRTHSDGEVICHLYDECGEDLFEKLDGMFAVALWSEREKKLILARDIPGEKPLYYYQYGSRELIFASELKSLILFPGLDLSLNFQGLWDFPTFAWIPEPDTVYKKARMLERSHMLICDENGIRIKPYENKFYLRELADSDQEVIEEIRRVVSESVKSRLLSDVPLGCFLSGGLDSSIVATLASKQAASLDTFTIGFEDVFDPYHGTADESVYSAAYADKLGTKHHTIHIEADDFLKDLIKFCSSADQPFAVSSAIGIMAVARAAHEEGIKVLLSGDCADECFGGYSWYFYLNSNGYESKGLPVREKVVSFQNFGMDLDQRLKILFAYRPQERAWAWHYYAAESEKTKIFNPEVFGRTISSIRFFEEFDNRDHWSAEDFIKQDRNFYLFNEMLQKVDRMTMAYSVEGRVPFAAPAVLGLSDKLKYRHMVRGSSLKWALREAFRDILPEEIYSRPKHGFNVPVDYWLKNDLADLFEETFSSGSNLSKRGIINQQSRDQAYAMVQDKERLNGHSILSFIMLNIWLGSH